MGATDIQQVILVLVAILFSMTLHEAMHRHMRYFLGGNKNTRKTNSESAKAHRPFFNHYFAAAIIN